MNNVLTHLTTQLINPPSCRLFQAKIKIFGRLVVFVAEVRKITESKFSMSWNECEGEIFFLYQIYTFFLYDFFFFFFSNQKNIFHFFSLSLCARVLLVCWVVCMSGVFVCSGRAIQCVKRDQFLAVVVRKKKKIEKNLLCCPNKFVFSNFFFFSHRSVETGKKVSVYKKS